MVQRLVDLICSPIIHSCDEKVTEFYHLAPSKKIIFSSWVFGRFPWYSTWTSRMYTCSLIKIINEKNNHQWIKACVSNENKLLPFILKSVICIPKINASEFLIIGCCSLPSSPSLWMPQFPVAVNHLYGHYCSKPNAVTATNSICMSCILKVSSTFEIK